MNLRPLTEEEAEERKYINFARGVILEFSPMWWEIDLSLKTWPIDWWIITNQVLDEPTQNMLIEMNPDGVPDGQNPAGWPPA